MQLDKIKTYMDENLLTKKEAMEITGQTLTAFDQAVTTGKLVPFFERGNDRSKVRLYLKSDVEEYAKRRMKRLNQLKKAPLQ